MLKLKSTKKGISYTFEFFLNTSFDNTIFGLVKSKKIAKMYYYTTVSKLVLNHTCKN